MARVGIAQRVWLAALLTLLTLSAGVPSAQAQDAYELTPLGSDSARGVDRYQVLVRAGGSFWDLATSHLPLLALEQGDLKAVEAFQQGWRAEYPDRNPNGLRPDDSFVLEVPTGTFVAKTSARQDDRLVFESFAGDVLTTFPRDPVVAYRLRRAASPDQAEVLIHGGQASAVEEAKRVFDVDPPDFIQVRSVRAALQERTVKLTVDLNRKYLDDFRNYRDQASRVEDVGERLKAYWFDRSATDVPYVRVDDGVGDETDPGNFPRVFRVAYYRDGTVRRYIVTESGDAMSTLSRPDNAAWTKVLPAWQEWSPGQPETLPPFTSAVSAAGALQPNRILVLAYQPRTGAGSQPARTSPAGSGLECLGIPLGLLMAAGVLVRRR